MGRGARWLDDVAGWWEPWDSVASYRRQRNGGEDRITIKWGSWTAGERAPNLLQSPPPPIFPLACPNQPAPFRRERRERRNLHPHLERAQFVCSSFMVQKHNGYFVKYYEISILLLFNLRKYCIFAAGIFANRRILSRSIPLRLLKLVN